MEYQNQLEALLLRGYPENQAEKLLAELGIEKPTPVITTLAENLIYVAATTAENNTILSTSGTHFVINQENLKLLIQALQAKVV